MGRIFARFQELASKENRTPQEEQEFCALCAYIDEHVDREQRAKTAIFSMGLPASGKSTTLKAKYGNDYRNFNFLDCDSIKEEHPDYDPKRPELVHDWSKEQLKKRVALALERGDNIIMDSTATNISRIVAEMEDCKRKGYFVHLVYVRVSLETSKARNAKRTRTVPVSLIEEKFEIIEKAWDVLASVADSCELINND